MLQPSQLTHKTSHRNSLISTGQKSNSLFVFKDHLHDPTPFLSSNFSLLSCETPFPSSIVSNYSSPWEVLSLFCLIVIVTFLHPSVIILCTCNNFSLFVYSSLIVGTMLSFYVYPLQSLFTVALKRHLLNLLSPSKKVSNNGFINDVKLNSLHLKEHFKSVTHWQIAHSLFYNDIIY